MNQQTKKAPAQTLWKRALAILCAVAILFSLMPSQLVMQARATESGSTSGGNTSETQQGQTGEETGNAQQGQTGEETGNTQQGQAGEETGNTQQGQTGAETGNAQQGQAGEETGNTKQGQTGAETGNTQQGQTGAETGNTKQGQSGQQQQQPTTYELKITVKSKNGSPISGAKVTVNSQEHTTGTNGEVKIDGLEANTYAVKVTAQHYQEKNTSVTLSADKTSAMVELDPEEYAISVNSGDGFTVNAPEKVTYGSNAEVKITVAQGYELVSVTINGEDRISSVTNGKLTIQKVDKVQNIIVTCVQTHTVTLTIGENGEIKENDHTHTGGEVKVTVENGKNFVYVANANKGYHVQKVMVDNNAAYELADGEEIKQSFGGQINNVTADHTIQAVFAPNSYQVQVQVVTQTQNGTATIQQGETEYSLNDEGKTDVFTVRYDEGIDFTITPNRGYEAEVTVGDDIISPKEGTQNTYHVGDIAEDCTVQVTVTPATYTVTGFNPLGDSVTATFQPEDGQENVTLTAPEAVTGYTFVGWAKAENGTITSQSSVVDNLPCSAEEDYHDTDLYAVWSIDAVSATAKGIVNGADAENQPTDTWFDGNYPVTMSLSSKAENIEYLCTEGEQSITIANNAFEVGEAAGGEVSHTYTISAQRTGTINETAYTYTLSEPVTFVVKQDKQTPTLLVKQTEEHQWNAQGNMGTLDRFHNDTDSYIITAGDGANGSGLSKIEYQYVDFGEANGWDASEILSKLEEKGWTACPNSETNGEGNSVATVSFQQNGKWVLAARATDQVGNVHYADSTGVLFDNVKPEITVNYDQQPKSDKTIYSKSDLTATITITDDALVFGEEDYENFTVSVNDTAVSDQLTDVQLMHDDQTGDTWTAKLVLDAETYGNTGAITVKVDANDKCGNPAESYTCSSLMIDTQKPTVSVSFQYQNDVEQKTETGKEAVYSNDSIVATITVTDDNLLQSNATGYSDYAVTVGSNQVSVNGSVNGNQWSGQLTLQQAKGETLSISASDVAGNQESYTSGKLYINSTAPTISVSYAYQNVGKSNLEAENSDFTYSSGDIIATVTVDGTALDYAENGFEPQAVVGETALTPANITWTDGGTQWKGYYTIAKSEYENNGPVILKVTAVDECGNQAQPCQSGSLIIDSQPASVTSATLTVKGNAVLNFLSFGIFFNTKATLSVHYDDSQNGSGVVKAVLLKDGETYQQNTEMVSQGQVGGAQSGSVTFDIPYENLDQVLQGALSIVLTDYVGNESDAVKLEKATQKASSYVMYETTAPAAETNALEETVSYHDQQSGSYWIRSGKDITINVSDEDSGLNTVTIKNGTASAKSTGNKGSASDENGTYQYGTLSNKTTSVTYTIAYADLNEGQNTITVDAVDNSGNEMEQKQITVFKDSSVAQIDGLTVSGETWSDTLNALTFGSYQNAKVQIAVQVSDGEGSSAGIQKILLLYGNHEINMTLSDTNANTEAANTIMATAELSADANSVQNGDLKIRVTDNVGNSVTYSNLSEFDTTNLKINSLMLEKENPVVEKFTPMAAKFTGQDGKLWYDTKDVTYTVKASDANAGIRSIVVKLNDQDIVTKEYYTLSDKTSTDTFEIKLSDYDAVQEGENKLKVIVTDNAGNYAFEESGVYIDLTAPKVTSASIALKDSAVNRVLRFLTFGTFFNAQTVLTVSYDDTKGECDIQHFAGVQKVVLYKNGQQHQVKELGKQDVATTGSVAFVIPETDAKTMLEGEFTIAVADAVNNTAEAVELKSVLEQNQDSSYLQYETTAPAMETNFKTEGVSHFDKDSNTYWVLDGQPITITVSDTESGLYKVTIQNIEGNTKVSAKSTTEDGVPSDETGVYTYDAQTEKTAQVVYSIAYADLHEGENVITVYATDNSGNEMEPQTITVYRDTNLPVITALTMSGEGWNNEYNALKFGNYFNKNVTVTVDVKDGVDAQGKNGICSAGFQKAELIYNGTAYELKLASTKATVDRNATTKAVYTLALPEPPVESDLQIVLTDNVGNSRTYGRDAEEKAITKDFGTTNMQENVNSLMMEDVAPVVDTLEPMKAVYTDKSGNRWYNTLDVDYTIVTSDADSGIRSIAASLNGKQVDFWDYHAENAKTTQKRLSIRLSDYKTVKEGKNVLTVTVTDNAGNQVTSKENVVYIDLTEPEIIGFRFNLAENPDNNTTVTDEFGTFEDIGEVVEKTEYGFYFKKAVKVTILSGDASLSSGVSKISYRAVDQNGKVISGTDEKAKVDANTDTFTTSKATFTIPANFKGSIYAYAEDNVHNYPAKMQDGKSVPYWVDPDDSIVENAAQHKASSDIVFTTPATTHKTADGQNLYDGNVAVSFRVTDTFSGIRSIQWTVTSPDDDRTPGGTVTVDNNGKLSGDRSGWKINQREKNLVTVMTNTITVSNNSNDIKVTVKLTDRAGNVSEKDIRFSIDKTAPIIVVTYNNNNPDPTYQDFYKEDRTATIVITERNFDASNVNLQITNTLGSIPGLSGWTRNAATNHASDRDTYTATVTFHEDGDYVYDLGFTDLAGNRAQGFNDRFTIDEIAPKISVTYVNEDGRVIGMEEYSNKPVTVSISITERNFDAGRIAVSVTSDGAAYPVNLNWNSSGDQNTASFKLGGETHYTFDISATDKAGNQAETFPTHRFYADETAPELNLFDVEDGKPYPGDIVPKTTFSDKYYASYETTLVRTVRNQKNVDITEDYVGAFATNATGGNGQIDNLASTMENDGIYTWTVTVKDRAGNETTKTVTYSVNRFGSVYVYSNALLKALEGYHQSVEGDLYISIYNADRLESGTLEINRDGSTIQTQKLTLAGDQDTGNSGWFEYTVPIRNEDLKMDGRYEIILTDHDMAGNTRTNGDQPIWFYVDTTPPVFDSIIGLESDNVDANELTVTYTVSDAIALREVSVYVNGKAVSTVNDFEGQNSYSGSFVIGEGLRQTVRLVAVDLAGTVTDTEQSFEPGYAFHDVITVSTNPFVRWYANTPLFVGSLSATAGVLGGGTWFFVAGKRRKKEKETAAAEK